MATAGSIDYVFQQLTLDGNVWATSIAGFVIVLAVVFLGVAMLGRANQKIDAFGISMLVFIGILISSLVGLFPWAYLVIFLVVAFVVILLAKVFGGGNNG